MNRNSSKFRKELFPRREELGSIWLWKLGKEILSNVLETYRQKNNAFRKMNFGRQEDPLAAAMKLYMKFGFHIIEQLYGQKDMNEYVLEAKIREYADIVLQEI